MPADVRFGDVDVIGQFIYLLMFLNIMGNKVKILNPF